MEEMIKMENVMEEVAEQVIETKFDMKSGVKGALVGAAVIVGGKIVYKHVVKPAYGKIKDKIKKNKGEDQEAPDNVVNIDLTNEESEK